MAEIINQEDAMKCPQNNLAGENVQPHAVDSASHGCTFNMNAEVRENKTTKELSETDICPSVLFNDSHDEVEETQEASSRTNGLICSFSNNVVVSGSCDSKAMDVKCENVSSDKELSNDLPKQKSECSTDISKHLSESDMNGSITPSAEEKIVQSGPAETTLNETDSESELCSLGNSDEDPNINSSTLDELKVPRNPIFNGDQSPSKPSSLKRPAEDDIYVNGAKRKRTIQFNGVTVFYFPRSQGFTCVPSQGGSTLGMSRHHFLIKQFSLSEYAAEQRRAHREYLLRVRQQKHNRKKDMGSQCSSSEDSEENSEEASDISDSELESDSFFFLQPLPIRQRRALLRQAGIRQIEGLEKEECKDIRISREMCGCQCKMYCHPDTCQCAEAGIKCQVDRHNFPCGCSREGCGNPNGRIEFNPIRVRTHFLHTLMRLEIEKRQNSDGSWDNCQGSEQKVANSSWLTQAGSQCSAESYALNGALGRTLPFFNAHASTLPPGTPEVSSCASNSGQCAPYAFDRSEKESSSFQENREYNAGSCSMFTNSLSSPFDSLTSLASFGDCSTPFHPPNSLSPCYHANSFPKFPSCSSAFNTPLSCSAAMAMLVPGNPFSLDGSCSSSNHPIAPVATSCVSLAKLLPQEDANRFALNEFSQQDYINKTDDDNTPDKESRISLPSVLDNIDDLGRSKECLTNHTCSLTACLATCSDSLSCLQGTPSLNDLRCNCSTGVDFSMSNFVESISGSKPLNSLASKNLSFSCGVTDSCLPLSSGISSSIPSTSVTGFGIGSDPQLFLSESPPVNPLGKEPDNENFLLLDDKAKKEASLVDSSRGYQASDFSFCGFDSSKLPEHLSSPETSQSHKPNKLDEVLTNDVEIPPDTTKAANDANIEAQSPPEAKTSDAYASLDEAKTADDEDDNNSDAWQGSALESDPKCSSPAAETLALKSSVVDPSLPKAASLKAVSYPDPFEDHSGCLLSSNDTCHASSLKSECASALSSASSSSETRPSEDSPFMETAKA